MSQNKFLNTENRRFRTKTLLKNKLSVSAYHCFTKISKELRLSFNLRYIIIFLILFLGLNLSCQLSMGETSDKNSREYTPENFSKISSENDSVSHGDKFASIYFLLFVIIAGAVIGRFIAKKINQPVVLGELIAGVIIGVILYQLNSPVMTLIRHQDDVNKIIQTNLTGNTTWEESVKKNIPKESLTEDSGNELAAIMLSSEFPYYNMTVQSIFLLSSFGVLLLLFVVGLESSIEDMMSVGGGALVTAVIGVVVPSLLGYFTSVIFLPNHDPNFYLFVGATLCATSIGITARVFKDMHKLHIPEAKIVLGAAVIDDVLGLIVLAVVAGIISSGSFEISTVLIILAKAVLFLGITLLVGKKFLRRQIKIAAIVENKNVRLLFPFAMLVFLSWLSDKIGLASIVGAFAAGLIIKEEYFNDALKDKEKTVKEVIEPIETIFAPVFFVIMGLQVDLSAFANFNILGVALVLTAVAVVGKLVSGIFNKGLDKKIIGIGMVPRGEVGLIFASIGKAIGVLDGALFSAIIIIVILTTFLTPPALKWAFEKYESKH